MAEIKACIQNMQQLVTSIFVDKLDENDYHFYWM
jgi:hypothetical protein